MKRLALLLLLPLLPEPAHAQRRAITAQDFITFDRPGEPAISPDGRWVVTV